jgi:hypothetical protein
VAIFPDKYRILLAKLLIWFLVLDIMLFILEEITFVGPDSKYFIQSLQSYYLVMIIPVIVIVLVYLNLKKPQDNGWRKLSEILAVLFIVSQLAWYGNNLILILQAWFHFQL